MKKIFTTLCLIGLVALVSIPSFGQRTRRKSTQKVKVVFNYGTVDGQIYTNDFLGLKFTIPEDLIIQDREAFELILNSGMKESQKSKVLLIGKTSKNVSFGCFTKKLTPLLRNITAKQVLQSVIDTQPISLTQQTTVFSTTVKQEKFGSNVLPFVEFVTDGIKQRMYMIVKKGYLINFILTYLDKSEFEMMNSILADADLNWKKS